MRTTKHHRNPRQAGLTLLELLLALGGTGFVAVAVATMLSAVTQGTTTRTDIRSLAVKRTTFSYRIDAAIRSSTQVLAATADTLVLWISDADSSGEPNLSELRRVERHSASKELRSYTAPASLASGSDTSFPLATTDFNTATAALRDTSSFEKELWGTEVNAFTVQVNASAVQDATLVSYRLEITNGHLVDTLVSAARLRANNINAASPGSSSSSSSSSSSGSSGSSGGSSSGGSSSDDDDDGKGKSSDDDDDGKSKSSDDDDDGKSKSSDDDDDGKSSGGSSGGRVCRFRR